MVGASAVRPRPRLRLSGPPSWSSWGRTTASPTSACARRCRRTRVSCKCYAVDTWKGDAHAGPLRRVRIRGGERVQRGQLRRRSRSCSGPPSTERTTNFGDQTVDLLHIDGLHTYEAVRHDFEIWWPKVRPGGVVLLHDTAARHADFGVWKLWEELARQFPHFEFTHSWGLGVLRKPGGSRRFGVLAHTLLRIVARTGIPPALLQLSGARAGATCSIRRRLPPGADTFSGVSQSGWRIQRSHRCHDGTARQGNGNMSCSNFRRGRGAGRIRVDPAERPCLIRTRRCSAAASSGWRGSAGSWTTADEMQAFSPTVDLVRLPGNDGTTLSEHRMRPSISAARDRSSRWPISRSFSKRECASPRIWRRRCAPAVERRSDTRRVSRASTLEAALQSKTSECDTALGTSTERRGRWRNETQR